MSNGSMTRSWELETYREAGVTIQTQAALRVTKLKDFSLDSRRLTMVPKNPEIKAVCSCGNDSEST